MPTFHYFNMVDNKIRLPSSGGGIVRFTEDEGTSNIMLTPMQVVYIIGGFLVVLGALYMFGMSFLGF